MIDQLVERIQKTEAPIVVGLDPQMKFIPDEVKNPVFDEMGETLEAAGEILFRFNKKIVDATYDLIPAVKPQIAMYERFGLPGLDAYQKTIDYCKAKGLVVIGDVKRGDIGSTSEAYADAHLGRVMVGDREYKLFDEDFATVNPYLGSDGVKPFLKVCDDQDKGIFILVKTSNPSSGEFQDRPVLVRAGGLEADGPTAVFAAGRKTGEKKEGKPERAEGKKAGARRGGLRLTDLLGAVSQEVADEYELRPLYEIVADQVNLWAREPRLLGKCGYSEVGAVVGATYPEMGKVLRKLMPQSYILVPGYGAQGGKGKDLKHFFHKDGLGAIVNSSRGIIAAYLSDPYKEKYGPEDFADASRAAVKAMKKDIMEAL